jgi:hypothetical protein
MVGREQGTALQHVKLLFEVGAIGSLSDRQLLEQFQSRARDAAEAAFAILVERHGPMVIRTCRSVLQDEHAVEDAFKRPSWCSSHGKRSLGGSGEMIELQMPDGASRLLGVKIHGSRYGTAQAPKESFLIYFMNKDRTRIIHTETAPYSKFKRGAEEWVEFRFESPLAGLSKSFWIVIDFRAAQTKGVYVSYNTTTGGKYSRIGLPGMASNAVDFGGDWMIQAIFAE